MKFRIGIACFLWGLFFYGAHTLGCPTGIAYLFGGGPMTIFLCWCVIDNHPKQP